ncbi:hypothetical protein KS4_26170 [Poriferisphaera corsica]|uniref:Uncharacterized protein n=1 Tax=Poriferisphaera corsica TaxID=2528020 RepID=A0A517YWH6_9BACT|nr:hypothetical protein [Poriferisphaera corsica]QDU34547.1 hypothetical protein KS4_26170 [Poriferisphaera corsica]
MMSQMRGRVARAISAVICMAVCLLFIADEVGATESVLPRPYVGMHVGRGFDRGIENDLPLSFYGGEMDGMKVGYWAWSLKERGNVKGWGEELQKKPWVIHGEKLSELADGDYKIVIYASVPGKRTQYGSKWVRVFGKKKQSVIVEVAEQFETVKSEVVTSVMPVVRFAHSGTVTIDRGAASEVRLDVSGALPRGFKASAWAWSEVEKGTVSDWDQTIDPPNWKIDGRELAKLPLGRNKVQVAYRADGLGTKYLSQWVLVKETKIEGGVASEDEDGKIAVTKLPEFRFAQQRYEIDKGDAIDLMLMIKGGLPKDTKFGYWAWSQALNGNVAGWGKEMVGGNFVVKREDLNLLEPGQYKVMAYMSSSVDKTKYISCWMTVNEVVGSSIGGGDVVVVELEPVAMPQLSLANGVEYVKGDGKGLDIEVNGDLPSEFKLGYWAWSNELGKTVSNWGEVKDGGSWGVTAEEIAELPEGRNKIIFYMSAKDLTTAYTEKWVTVKKGEADPVDPNGPGVVEMPIVSFEDGQLMSLTKGAIGDLKLKVEGNLPTGFELGYWAWAESLGKSVPDWGKQDIAEPWVITGDLLEGLPSGRNKLIVYYSAPDLGTKYLQQWVEVKDVASGGTGDGSSQGSNGSGSGSGSTGGGTDGGNSNGSGSGNGSGDGTNSGGGSSNGGTGNGSNGGGNTGGGSGTNNGGVDDPFDGSIRDWDNARLPIRNGFLGMNLGAVTFWSDSWVWTNVFMQSTYRREENGWKIYEAMQGISGKMPDGEYTVEFDGDGEVECIVRDSGIQIRVKGDAKNIRVWAPDCGPGEKWAGYKFHPMFLERLKPFGTVRYMDWQLTNNSERVKWDNRTLPIEATQCDKPIAIELMIELANKLKFNPWFCMPHKADDEYVRQFAEMVREKLDPNLKVYVEYSNEVWNPAFKQFHWITDKGKTNPALSSMNAGHRWLAQWGIEARRDLDIWSDVFNGQMNRLVRVYAGQETNPWIAEMVLSQMDGGFDAIASTAYFGAHPGSTLSVGEIMAHAVMDIQNRTNKRSQHHQLAQAWSQKLGRPIDYISYEAGQHLVSSDDTMTGALIAAQSSVEMYQAMIENMKSFEKSGGSMYMAYQYVRRPSKWGSWGHLEYQDQPIEHAIKYRALIDYLTSTARLELAMFD